MSLKQRTEAVHQRQRQADVCRHAAELLQTTTGLLLLDTETTGLGEYDEVIELAILDENGHLLFTSLIQPETLRERSAFATEIHGITREELLAAPTFPSLWPRIEALLSESRITISYNAAFDSRLLAQTARRYGYRLPHTVGYCVMEAYARYHGRWSDYYKGFIYQSLEAACQVLGVKRQTQTHRAEADARDALAVLHALAALEGQVEQIPLPKAYLQSQEEPEVGFIF